MKSIENEKKTSSETTFDSYRIQQSLIDLSLGSFQTVFNNFNFSTGETTACLVEEENVDRDPIWKNSESKTSEQILPDDKGVSYKDKDENADRDPIWKNNESKTSEQILPDDKGVSYKDKDENADRDPIWENTENKVDEKISPGGKEYSCIKIWQFQYEKIFSDALMYEQQIIPLSGPLPLLPATEQLQNLIKKLLDKKTEVTFYHDENKHLVAEWKGDQIDVTKCFDEGADLNHIVLTDDEITVFLDYVRATQLPNPRLEEKYYLHKEQMAGFEETPLKLGEKIEINRFTGIGYKDINSFLNGHARQDLPCWKNLDGIAFQNETRNFLFSSIMATHGLKKLNNVDSSFKWVSEFPELKEMTPNRFYIEPGDSKDILFSYAYRKNHNFFKETLTREELEKLDKNNYSENQREKLLCLSERKTEFSNDNDFKTYLKYLLNTTEKTISILARFEKIEDTNNLPAYMKKRINAYQKGTSFKENRFFSSIRLSDFNSRENQDKLEELIKNNNVYLLICSEKSRQTISCYSEIPQEYEVLFPPNSSFVCLAYQVDCQGNHYFILKEADGLGIKNKKSPSYDYNFWEKYNNSSATDAKVLLMSKDTLSSPITVDSYTDFFFEDHKLDKYLNTSCHKILQLGSSVGKFIEKYKNSGWSVVGYDYASAAIEELKRKGIEAKQIDLNATDSETETLNYAVELSKDISNPVNLLLIRVLQYLEPKALNLLLLYLMDNTAPGSVFFIVSTIKEQTSSDQKPVYQKGYLASFFKPRTDMKLLINNAVNASDELLVVQKLDKNRTGYSRFFKPALIGAATVLSGAVFGMSGAALVVSSAYLLPKATTSLRKNCKRMTI